MKSYKAWRYRCDYCGKANGNPAYMKKHEKHCTMNPERVCRFCRMVRQKQNPITELVAIIVEHRERSLEKLREVTDNCPACILAAIRQYRAGLADDDAQGHEEAFEWFVGFNFSTESADFRKEYYDGQNEDAYNRDREIEAGLRRGGLW